jgi:hypothetical protein
MKHDIFNDTFTVKYIWYNATAWKVYPCSDNVVLINHWDILNTTKLRHDFFKNLIDNNTIEIIDEKNIMTRFMSQLKLNMDEIFEGNLWNKELTLTIEHNNRMDLMKFIQNSIKLIPPNLLNITKKGIMRLSIGTENFTFTDEVPGKRPCSDGEIYENMTDYASYLLGHKPVIEYFQEAYPMLIFQTSATSSSTVLPTIICSFHYTPPTIEKILM